MPDATIANLRHLYQNMVNDGVRDTASAKRIAEGLLAPVIEHLERRAQPAPEASPAPAYRLLERGRDTIQADDEFLREDGVTWRRDPSGIFVGCTYEGNILLPARRAITVRLGTNQPEGQNVPKTVAQQTPTQENPT